MLLIKSITRWCYTVCIAGIALTACFAILAVWTEAGRGMVWQGITSIGLVIGASFSTLIVTHAFWGRQARKEGARPLAPAIDDGLEPRGLLRSIEASETCVGGLAKVRERENELND